LTSLRDPLTSNSPEIRPHINFHHIRDGTRAKNQHVSSPFVMPHATRPPLTGPALRNPFLLASHDDSLSDCAHQVVSLNGKVLEMPTTVDAARDRLFELCGKTHELHSAVALAEEGSIHLNPRRDGPADDEGVLASIRGSLPRCYRSTSLRIARGLSVRPRRPYSCSIGFKATI
jgi:hypothetical protein